MKHLLALVVVMLFTSGCCLFRGQSDADRSAVEAEIEAAKQAAAPSLLQGGTDTWQPINFGGEGDVYFEDGVLNLDSGQPLTGVIYKGDLEALLGTGLEDYVITLETQRVEGVDMFLGLTFPVGKDGHVSLVLGGWAGAITGLSNLDGLNASENVTTQYHGFKDNQWYAVKIKVTKDKIQCWLDGKPLVDINRADFTKYDTHGAVTDTKPFGMFSYSTWGKVRNMKAWKLE